MKIIILFLAILSITRCENKTVKSENFKSGFINESRNYLWGRNKNIILKNIGDSEKIFAITADRGEILYQQPINATFSDYHQWILYVDEKENAYFYNGDYQISKALIWNNAENKYDEVNFCFTKVSLPQSFRKKLLEPTSNFKNCKSLE